MSFVYLYLIPLITCVLIAKFYKESEFAVTGFIPVFNIILALGGFVYFVIERTVNWVEK